MFSWFLGQKVHGNRAQAAGPVKTMFSRLPRQEIKGGCELY